LQGFRLNAARRRAVRVGFEGHERLIELDASAEPLPVLGSGGQAVVFHEGQAFAFEPPRARGAQQAEGGGSVLSPMPGRIVSVSVAPGAAVRKGEPLVTLEAMKMEHTLTAPFDGVVKEVNAAEGDQVAEGVLLVRIEG